MGTTEACMEEKRGRERRAEAQRGSLAGGRKMKRMMSGAGELLPVPCLCVSTPDQLSSLLWKSHRNSHHVNAYPLAELPTRRTMLYIKPHSSIGNPFLCLFPPPLFLKYPFGHPSHHFYVLRYPYIVDLHLPNTSPPHYYRKHGVSIPFPFPCCFLERGA
jgi:hypothetical protein